MSGGTASRFGRGDAPSKRAKDVAAVAGRVAVVLRNPLVMLDVEAEPIAVVVGSSPDVLDEQDGRVPRQPRH
jgi:hypothetical protein